MQPSSDNHQTPKPRGRRLQAAPLRQIYHRGEEDLYGRRVVVQAQVGRQEDDIPEEGGTGSHTGSVQHTGNLTFQFGLICMVFVEYFGNTWFGW